MQKYYDPSNGIGVQRGLNREIGVDEGGSVMAYKPYSPTVQVSGVVGLGVSRYGQADNRTSRLQGGFGGLTNFCRQCSEC
jgi:hypothetical protein